jgi:hypothetical protein
MWFVSRTRHAAVVAENAGLRRRVVATEARHDEAEGERRQAAEELAATTIVNVCLTEELGALKEQLAEARALADDSLASQLRAQLKREKRRADRLQKQYDDSVGMGAGRIEDSSRWQPGYKASSEVAS